MFDDYYPNPLMTLTSNQELVDELDKRSSLAGFYKGAQWKQNQTIQVSFLDGTTQQKDAVKNLVNTHLVPLVNLQITFVEDKNTKAEIRISFVNISSIGLSGVGLSLYGSQAQSQSIEGKRQKTSASMILNSVDSYVVLHEWGHAMSLIHEHQSPCDNPLSPGKGEWEQQIPKSQIEVCSPYDKYSIMNYAYIKGTQPGQFYSDVDKQWLSKIYPKSGTTTTTPTPKPKMMMMTTPSTLSTQSSPIIWMVIFVTLVVVYCATLFIVT